MHNQPAASASLRSTPRERLRTAALFSLASALTFAAITVNLIIDKNDSTGILQNAGIGIAMSFAAIQITRRVAARLLIGEPIDDTKMNGWLSEFDTKLGISSAFALHRLKRLHGTAAYIKSGDKDVIATSLDESTTPEIERKGITAHEYAHRNKDHIAEVQNWNYWTFIISSIEPSTGFIATAITFAMIRKNELQADRIAGELTGDGYHLARFLTRSNRQNTTKPTAMDKVLDGVGYLFAMHPSSDRRAKALLARSAKFKALKKQFGLNKA